MITKNVDASAFSMLKGTAGRLQRIKNWSLLNKHIEPGRCKGILSRHLCIEIERFCYCLTTKDHKERYNFFFNVFFFLTYSLDLYKESQFISKPVMFLFASFKVLWLTAFIICWLSPWAKTRPAKHFTWPQWGMQSEKKGKSSYVISLW